MILFFLRVRDRYRDVRSLNAPPSRHSESLQYPFRSYSSIIRQDRYSWHAMPRKDCSIRVLSIPVSPSCRYPDCSPHRQDYRDDSLGWTITSIYKCPEHLLSTLWAANTYIPHGCVPYFSCTPLVCAALLAAAYVGYGYIPVSMAAFPNLLYQRSFRPYFGPDIL